MNAIEKITSQLEQMTTVEIAWLYGSRATNSYSEESDFDIAVVLKPDPNDSHQIVDDTQYLLAELDGINVPVSVVNLVTAPVPLALNVIDEGLVIVCNSDFRLRQEQQRIWSLWEEYKYQHEQNRKEL
jgi:predicted nucleotidyltransferase